MQLHSRYKTIVSKPKFAEICGCLPDQHFRCPCSLAQEWYPHRQQNMKTGTQSKTNFMKSEVHGQKLTTYGQQLRLSVESALFAFLLPQEDQSLASFPHLVSKWPTIVEWIRQCQHSTTGNNGQYFLIFFERHLKEANSSTGQREVLHKVIHRCCHQPHDSDTNSQERI